MSYYTLTLYEYLIAELNKQKVSETYDKTTDSIVRNKLNASYVNKIMNYDPVVEKILNDKVFLDMKLTNPKHDQAFKKMFLNLFLENEIKWQTMSNFSRNFVGIFSQYQLQLNSYYENYDKYISGLEENKSEDENLSDRQNRQAYADLPQNIVNLDVKNNIMHTATDNTIQMTAEKSNGNKKDTKNSYNLEVLLLSMQVLEDILKIFKKKLFLGVM